MPRISWKRNELQFLIDNYETMTTDELCEALGRNRKSVNRKIEKLREEGKIGHRSRETIRRAYNQRSSGRKRSSGNKGRKGKLPVDDYDYEEI